MSNVENMKALQLIVIKNDIRYYCDLMDYLYDNDLFELFEFANLNTAAISLYINSRCFKKSK